MGIYQKLGGPVGSCPVCYSYLPSGIVDVFRHYQLPTQVIAACFEIRKKDYIVPGPEDKVL